MAIPKIEMKPIAADTEKLISALENLNVPQGPDAPAGAIVMNKQDHQAKETNYIYKVDGQKDDIMKQLKQEPHTPTSLVEGTEGLSPNNPHHGEAVRRHLATLERNGHIEQVKDERGRLLGWQAKDDEGATRTRRAS